MSAISLDPKTRQAIQVQAPQMEAEMMAEIQRFQGVVVKGVSKNGLVIATVDGNHQVLEIICDPVCNISDMSLQEMASHMREAINEAMYLVDLNIESELSTIQYKYLSRVIKQRN